MLSPEEITKEVKGVFGDDADVEIKFSANVDATYIEVSKRVGNEILMISACIPASEELQSEDPLKVIRQYIGYMYYYFLQAIEQEIESDSVRTSKRKTGEKGSGGSGPTRTYH